MGQDKLLMASLLLSSLGVSTAFVQPQASRGLCSSRLGGARIGDAASTVANPRHGRPSLKRDVFMVGFLSKFFNNKPKAAATPEEPSARKERRQVVLVGAGVSGLVCAKELTEAGKDVLVVESSDGVGGRVRTDKVKGFLLDRGFQVFLEGYPAVKRHLDYNDLELQRFWPGALVRADGKFNLVADPFRRPQDTVAGLEAAVGTFFDKARVGLMRVATLGRPLRTIFSLPETDTEAHLLNTLGLGPQIVDRFFRPFYQGVFLAPLNEQSSRMFDFLFQIFASDEISLPKNGIGAVAEQLASKLPSGTIRLDSAASSVEPGRVRLASGVIIEADAVVVATDELSAIKLLGDRLDAEGPVQGRGVTCLYYAFDGAPPLTQPLLILNGEAQNDPQKPVNNVLFINLVAPSYTPEGKTLVSVTVVGTPAGSLNELVRAQLSDWFGKEAVKQWELLKIYRIPYAQPRQNPPNDSFDKTCDLGQGLFVCGDHRGTATLNGAFESGERAAKDVLRHLATIDSAASGAAGNGASGAAAGVEESAAASATGGKERKLATRQ